MKNGTNYILLWVRVCLGLLVYSGLRHQVEAQVTIEWTNQHSAPVTYRVEVYGSAASPTVWANLFNGTQAANTAGTGTYSTGSGASAGDKIRIRWNAGGTCSTDSGCGGTNGIAGTWEPNVNVTSGTSAGGFHWDLSSTSGNATFAMSTTPVTYCCDVPLYNDLDTSVIFEVMYGTNTVVDTPALSVGDGHTIYITGQSAKSDVYAQAQTLASLEGGQVNIWALLWTSGSANWYICGGTPPTPTTNVVGTGYNGDIKTTNATVNFGSTNFPSNFTNLSEAQILINGFNSLASLAQTGNKIAEDLGSAQLNAMAGLSNAVITSASQITNAIAIGSTNAVWDGAGVTNLLGQIVTNSAGIKENLEGGPSLTATNNSSTHVGSAYTSAAAGNYMGTSNYLSTAETAGNSAFVAAGSMAFNAPATADDYTITYEIGGGHAPFVMSFNPLDNPTIQGIAGWIRSFIEAAMLMGFFAYAYRRSQVYIWEVIKASVASTAVSSIVQYPVQKFIAYFVMSAVMAVLASLPSFVITWFDGQGGFVDLFTNKVSQFHVDNAPTAVVKALDLANVFFPIALAVTQVISGLVFEISLSKVAFAAHAVVRFLKLACILLAVVPLGAAQVQVENFSGSPVTNRFESGSYTNQWIIPPGQFTLNVTTNTENWAWLTYSVDLEAEDGNILRFGELGMDVFTAKAEWEWFFYGFAFYTTLFLAGWLVRAYRSIGHATIAAAE